MEEIKMKYRLAGMEETKNEISFSSTENTFSYTIEGSREHMIDTILDCLEDMSRDESDKVVGIMEIATDAYREANK